MLATQMKTLHWAKQRTKTAWARQSQTRKLGEAGLLVTVSLSWICVFLFRGMLFDFDVYILSLFTVSLSIRPTLGAKELSPSPLSSHLSSLLSCRKETPDTARISARLLTESMSIYPKQCRKLKLFLVQKVEIECRKLELNWLLLLQVS